MAPQLLSIFLSLLLLLQTTSAQLGPNQNWTNPDSTKDFTSTFAWNSTIKVSWKGLLRTSPSKADLYVTSWDEAKYPYSSPGPIASNIDISTAGQVTWFINVPTDIIARNNSFVLRFITAGSTYGPLIFDQAPSPGFYLTASKATTTTTTTSTDKSQTGQSVSSTSATVIPSDTSAPAQSSAAVNSPQAVPQATQIGIGVGIGGAVLVILLFVAGCMFGRKLGRRRSKYNTEYGSERGFPHVNGSPTTGTMSGAYGKSMRTQTIKSKGSPSTVSSETPTEDNRTWYTNRTPWAEAVGDILHPIEKDVNPLSPRGNCADHLPPMERSVVRVRSGMHEVA